MMQSAGREHVAGGIGKLSLKPRDTPRESERAGPGLIPWPPSCPVLANTVWDRDGPGIFTVISLAEALQM